MAVHTMAQINKHNGAINPLVGDDQGETDGQTTNNVGERANGRTK